MNAAVIKSSLSVGLRANSCATECRPMRLSLLDALDGGERNELVLIAYALAHVDRAAAEIRQRTDLRATSRYLHS